MNAQRIHSFCSKNYYLTTALVICILIFSKGLSAQTDIEKPFRSLEQKLSEEIGMSWDNVWNECNTLRPHPVKSEREMEIYMQCLFEHYPPFIRTWVEHHKKNLQGAAEIMKTFVQQQLSQSGNIVNAQKNLAGIVGFCHQKLTAWHQRMANTANGLAACGFLMKGKLNDLREGVQKSYSKCTKLAQKFYKEMQKGTLKTDEEVLKKFDEMMQEMFSHPDETLGNFLTVFLSASDRLERQYPDFKRRYLQNAGEEGGNQPTDDITQMSDAVDTTLQGFVNNFDDMYTRIFDAMDSNARMIWKAMPKEKK